jgi:thiol-disulfide isomerase/thioredoxin
MIIELTPETFFEHVNKEGPLHVVMHYGASCGPCKMTIPNYEILASHFEKENFSNIKFYRFHQWEPEFKSFISENNLSTKGVPTFRYYYFGEILHEDTHSYSDANAIKEVIVEVVKGIEATMGGFSLHES